ncbi:hypothetical protein BCR33DRAFT_726276 [Rhizoclosmatium globosum]|uniref:C2H2-type domain-containing protein n=1 Tax=Rhizoclosmatium globosum TaxID=329046 RepID=A0A1Y2AUY6_9FUNG|nr:hypothetical protein BCR33DRAFT_726276 [Rhizoclosmatium globosum]|eukprot:ORY26413.1 hypothetical protein BCR33DRAFT_726276 [Rhizoclosmatium globosum]
MQSTDTSTPHTPIDYSQYLSTLGLRTLPAPTLPPPAFSSFYEPDRSREASVPPLAPLASSTSNQRTSDFNGAQPQIAFESEQRTPLPPISTFETPHHFPAAETVPDRPAPIQVHIETVSSTPPVSHRSSPYQYRPISRSESSSQYNSPITSTPTFTSTDPNANRTRNFSCSYCDNRFFRKQDMQRHEATHLANKQFECPIEGCGYAFARRDALIRHMNSLRCVKNKSTN